MKNLADFEHEFFALDNASAAKNHARVKNGVFAQVKAWGKENQWAVGIAEATAGASLIAFAINSGMTDLNGQVQILQTDAYNRGVAYSLIVTPGANFASTVGFGSMGLGALAGLLLGGIGIGFMGTGIGIPAAIVSLGGALVLGAAGYTLSDLTQKFLSAKHILDAPLQAVFGTTGLNFATLLPEGGILTIGFALLLDGLRRIVKDKKVRILVRKVADGIAWLTCESWEFAVKVGRKAAGKIKAGLDITTEMVRGAGRFLDARFLDACASFIVGFTNKFSRRTTQRLA